jgi:hypothetical protein
MATEHLAHLLLTGEFFSVMCYNYSMKKKTTTKIPKILQTSEGTGGVSLTVTGIGALLIIYVLESVGITVDKGEVITLVDNIATMVAMGVTVYGAARKIINAIK